MQKKVKKIERTVTEEKIEFIATDGRIFDCEDECKQYESSSKCAAQTAILDLTKQKFTNFSTSVIQDYMDEDNIRMLVFPQSENDVYVINRYLSLINGNKDYNELPSDIIGKHVVVETTIFEDSAWCFTLEDKIKRIQDFIDEFDSAEKK